MAKYFDEKKWLEAIKYDDWYLRLADDYTNLVRKADESSKQVSREIKEEVYSFFEDNLTSKRVAIGKSGPDWDAERKSIDTIVIHHTKNPSGITWQRLSAMHLIRLYAKSYASEDSVNKKSQRGDAIYSNHFRDGEQIFYAYHWLVRMDGKIERLLNDDEIGWHAGNWDVNCRSIAICLDNDFEDSSPADQVLSSVADLINKEYSQVQTINIKGHREINPRTTCPGNRFLDDWKEKIIQKIGLPHNFN